MNRAATHRSRLVPGGLLIALVIAACGGSAAASPPAPAASSTPAPSRTPDADQVAAATALAAFATLSAGDSLTYHLSQWVTMDAGSARLMDGTYDLDVADGSFLGTISIGGTELGLAHVDGASWVQGQDGAWIETDAFAQGDIDDILQPWRYLGAPDELRFISRDPQNLDNFQFHNSGPIPYQTASMKTMGFAGEIDLLTFVVTPTGIPVSAWMHATATPRTGQFANQELEILTSMEFTKVGEPIVIAVPR